MAVKSSMTHLDVEGPPHKHVIKLWVAYDAGGGQPGTTQANATILWNPAQLQLITGTSTPGGGVHSPGAGLVTWNDVPVDEDGTTFEVQLKCLAAALRSSQVEGVAEEHGTNQRPTRYSVTTTC